MIPWPEYVLIVYFTCAVLLGLLMPSRLHEELPRGKYLTVLLIVCLAWPAVSVWAAIDLARDFWRRSRSIDKS